jgi:pimeloyl-ACP methyl ester carboxylesterase
MQQQAQMLKVHGLDMYVSSLGEGPPVLLLHGFPDSHSVWRHQMRALADAGYRAIAPDLRGYGRSQAPADVASYSIEHLRDDVTGLLDALGIGQVILVGHDWGAAVAWQVAMHAPGRVERLVALSVGHPAAFVSAGLVQRLRSFYMAIFAVPGLAERLLPLGDWWFMRRYISDAAQVAQWRSDFSVPGRLTAALNYYRANLKMAARRNWPPVTMPVLGVWSSRDAALTEEQMRGSASHVAGPFRYERIDGVDHWMQLAAPAQVNALLLDFFGQARREP